MARVLVTGSTGFIGGHLLTRLLEISAHLSTTNTIWALPKGRGAAAELAEAQQAWQGVFHVEPSVTDAESYIVVATEVRARQ